MKNYLNKLESIKYRLQIIEHQRKVRIIDEKEYNKILNVLEKEVRDLENKIFNDKQVIE